MGSDLPASSPDVVRGHPVRVNLTVSATYPATGGRTLLRRGVLAPIRGLAKVDKPAAVAAHVGKSQVGARERRDSDSSPDLATGGQSTPLASTVG